MKREIPAPSLEEDASLRLCEAAGRLRYEDLPPVVVTMLKALVIDELGVIAGAARAPGIPELHRRLARWEREGSATALHGRRRMSPPSAALANDAAGAARDGGRPRRGEGHRLSPRLCGERGAARPVRPRLLQQPRQGLAPHD